MRLAAFALLAACHGTSSPPEGAPSALPATARGASDDPLVTVSQPPEVHAGQEMVARIAVAAPDGYEVNTRYPVKLALAQEPGVLLPIAMFHEHEANLNEHGLTFDVRLIPERGEHTVRGTLDVGMCKSDQCVSKTVPVAVVVAAK